MDSCPIDTIDELKISQDVQHDTNNIKSIKNTSIKKNITESDHRTSKRKNDISNLNTLKKKKKYETALAAIFPENDQSYLQYAQDYADGYMKKMREKLDPKSLELAANLFVSFGVADDSNIHILYQQITELFNNKNKDLMYEFLGFLLPGQALSIGKFSDYLELTRIKEFIRKLQVCMKKQPTQVRKVLDNLLNLSKNENISALEVHTVMHPLLKSNSILVDCFFQLIPTERPPESFFSDDNWEDLDIDHSINYGIDYEEIIPFELEDQTQLNVCHCTCHKFGDVTHCRSCGLKFFKGRVYFDSPEGLKLARISYEGDDSSIVQSKIDKSEVNTTVKQKNRKNLIKNSSPGSAEDIKCSTGTESEEDLIEVRPRKRQKSKVVQSLKLKFKKEDSPKCKDDQEISNEIGKSVIHVTNEELDSSEMVFFCISKAESNVKILPKKKIKHESKGSSQSKDCEIVNPIHSETSSSNNLFAVESERIIKTDIEASLSIINYNIDNVVKEIQTDKNVVPIIAAVDNLTTNIINTKSYFTPATVTTNDTKVNIKIESDKSPALTVNDLITEIKTEGNFESFTDITDINKLNNRLHQTSKEIGEELTHQFSVNSKHLTRSNESDKQVFKNMWVQEFDVGKINIKNENIDQNIATINSNISSTTMSNMILTDKELASQNEPIKITGSCSTNSLPTLNTNKKLINTNVTTKNEVIQRLPECYIDVMKQDGNESEKHLINKWTIDEDKIILQTCKRVEDIEVLLETIKRRIPQRSVSEIQERFTTLMALLEEMIDVKQN